MPFNLKTENSLSECRKRVFSFITLFLLVLIAYSNTLDASWHFDDTKNIISNKSLHLSEFNLPNVKETFFASHDGKGNLYRPIACLSFALNYYFGKANVFGYHLVNTMIHFISALFLYLFIQNTLKLPAVSERYGQDAHAIALLATVLWAVNPVQTQAVTYVVQRMASMAGMFYIAAMYAYLRGRVSVHLAPKMAFYGLCVVSGLLALGSKENAIMLPFSILLFDLFLIQGISVKTVKRAFLILIGITCSCLLIALFLKGPSIFNLPDLSTPNGYRGFSLGERLLTEPRVILFYISLLLYPMPNRLCLEHDIILSKGLLSPPSTLLAILTVLAILAVAIGKAKKWPLVSFCVIFFFLNHLVEGSIIMLELVFEHRNYIPSMLLFVPIALILVKTLNAFSHRKPLFIAICTLIIFIIVGFAHSTFIRNFVWKNNESLWLDAVDKNPYTPRPYNNLASHYFNSGKKDLAFEYCKKAIALKEQPNTKIHHVALKNMGVFYQSLGDFEKARSYFTQSLKLQPGYSLPYLGLGILAIKQKEDRDALIYLNKALDIDRDLLPALKYKGFVLLKGGGIDGAITMFTRALEIDPNDSYSLTHLGTAYKRKGELGRALAYFKKALRVNKRDMRINLNIIEIYLSAGHEKQAQDILANLFDALPNEKLFTLIDSAFFYDEANPTAPDLSIIAPLLEKTLTQMAERYHTGAMKLYERTNRESQLGH